MLQVIHYLEAQHICMVHVDEGVDSVAAFYFWIDHLHRFFEHLNC